MQYMIGSCGKYLIIITILLLAIAISARPEENSMCQIGGFQCVDLQPLHNDATFNLYDWGPFCASGLRNDIWKRHGVPFWYKRAGGDIRVAGAEWQPAVSHVISSSAQGGVAYADNQQPGNGSIAGANDDNYLTYWYAGEGRPHGKLWIEWPEPRMVDSVHMLSWASPQHAPQDYVVGLILPDGTRKQLAEVHRKLTPAEANGTIPAWGGIWNSWQADKTPARGIYLDVRSTIENVYGPVVYEFQARGEMANRGNDGKVEEREKIGIAGLPSEVRIDLKGAKAKAIHCLGQVYEGPALKEGEELGVGEYVIEYQDGEREAHPLVAGRNVAPIRYGNFVPEAELAFAFRDPVAAGLDEPGTLYYHVGEQAAVAPYRQLMATEIQVGRPGKALAALTFRCTNPKASLILAGLTLHQSGRRMNALDYGKGPIKPYPAKLDRRKSLEVFTEEEGLSRLALDGEWQYRTDPGNRGVAKKYFEGAPSGRNGDAEWKTMPVPSHWYAQGLDYHGVVWFRQAFILPDDFAGNNLWLRFGAVDYDARVWVNGEEAGHHRGAYSAFEIDATHLLKRGKENIITVRVDSPIDSGYCDWKTIIKGNPLYDIATPYNQEGCMGGITRPVSLIGRGEAMFGTNWTSCTLSNDLSRAHVKISADLTTAEAQPDVGPIEVTCRMIEPAENAKGKGSRKAAARIFEQKHDVSQTSASAIFDFDIDNPKVWMPWEQGTPYLHEVVFEARRDGKLLDVKNTRVGIREVAFDKEAACVWINHHRIFLKGVLYDDPHWMSLMTPAGYRQRLELMQRANLNTIRMVTHQSAPAMYELADEMGMLVWQEMPLQLGYASSEPVRRDIMAICRDTVLQTRSHASVIGWSAWNEGGQGEFTDRLAAMIRELDPTTRPISAGSGSGHFDIHTYANLSPWLCHRTALWTGTRAKFISEIGAYALSSPAEMNRLVGRKWFPFDTADYYWETFNEYRYNCGPVFREGPAPQPDWGAKEELGYVTALQPASERWLCQYMKYAYENFRGQVVEQSNATQAGCLYHNCNALIHCRFDDAMPSAYLGLVNYNGEPRKALDAMGEACQAVVPILYFDFQGAQDVRVVNDYWFRSWNNCTLEYRLTTWDGKVLKEGSRKFNLPAEAIVKILDRESIGDIWSQPGLRAELKVLDSEGKLLSRNRYDLTKAELRAFITSVYPPAPEKPYDSMVMTCDSPLPINEEGQGGVKAISSLPIDGEGQGGVKAISPLSLGRGAGVRGSSTTATLISPDGPSYSPQLLSFPAGTTVSLQYKFRIDRPGRYAIRAACNSSVALRGLTCRMDGKPIPLETVPGVDPNIGISRAAWGKHNINWFMGWQADLSAGDHELTLEGKSPESAAFVIDAMGVQGCDEGKGRLAEGLR